MERVRPIVPPPGKLLRFGSYKLLVRPLEEFVFYASFIAGEYDPLEMRQGDVVLDAGANVGDFTIQASLKVGPKGIVIAVEPNPDLLPYLEYNLNSNDCRNVRIVPVALGTPGRATLVRTADGGSVGTTLAEGGEGTNITVRSIREILDELGVGVPNVIKMDIEGAEYAALAGFPELGRVRAIAVELHGTPNLTSVPPLLSKSFEVRYETPKDVWRRTITHTLMHPLDLAMAEARSGFVAARGLMSTISGRGNPVPSVERPDLRIIYGRNRGQISNA